MLFNATIYYDAAREYLAILPDLHDEQRYVLSHYLAGVGVEAMFRAYRYRIDPTFDARHDLIELAKSSRFLHVIPASDTERWNAALLEVSSRRSNNHRYRSETALRAFLRQAGKNRGVKGDFLKESSRRMVSAAIELITFGVTRWKN